ncbi:hypothetical protein RJ639_029343 [Escallonia herrerae]|uniref:SAWADEE domain-containing protein n=1 Tax=Escallonia herrerae TaxID=1293975 RepID=A0AA88X840_9ASTE|nr:hypothetical protein RJ639_029343 [Escallonia herrerae]
MASSSAISDAVELEAMRKHDSSWHPCRVSLSPSGIGLIIDYGTNDMEDIIVNREEAVRRIRIRSLPLRGDDCSRIEQGEHVLATQKSESKSLFFDAEVEKVLKVRHSKRVHCRCTFMVKWLHQDTTEILTVPSSSIMKQTTKSIDIHPIVSAFFDTVTTLSFSISPLPTFAKVMECEIDLLELLEKQIEEITNSADASKKTNAEDILLGFEVDNKGQLQYRPLSASKLTESNIKVLSDQNRSKRYTHSGNKMQKEMGFTDLRPITPSLGEELPDSKSSLNPLAARAALASLMSKLPYNIEVSMFHEDKCFSYLSDITSTNPVAMGPSNRNSPCNSSVLNNSSMSERLSSKTQAASVPFACKADGVVKSLFSTGGVQGKTQLVDASHDLTKTENNFKTVEVTNSSAHCTCPIEQKKTRLTREAVQKATGIPDDDTDTKTCVEERNLTSKRRLIRSKTRKEEEKRFDEIEDLRKENVSANCGESYVSNQNLGGVDSYVMKDKKINKSHDTKRKTYSVELENPNKTRRLTRSAIQLLRGNETSEAVQGFENKRSFQDVRSDLLANNVSILEIKEQSSSTLDAEVDLSPTEGWDKKRKISAAVTATQKAKGSVDGPKRKSTRGRKQELRSSPQLRLLVPIIGPKKTFEKSTKDPIETVILNLIRGIPRRGRTDARFIRLLNG